MQLPAKRQKNREVEDEMIRPPARPGGAPLVTSRFAAPTTASIGSSLFFRSQKRG
jgi:hypothetical protein